MEMPDLPWGPASVNNVGISHSLGLNFFFC